MHVNRPIVIGAFLLMAAGAYNVLVIQRTGNAKPAITGPLTHVLVGGFILAFVVSLVDLVGGPVGAVGGMLIMLAVITAALLIIPDLSKRLQARG